MGLGRTGAQPAARANVKILLVGSGGREHALGWRLVQDEGVTVTSLPGNPGLASVGPMIEGIGPTDVGAIAEMTRVQQVDLVVVGPEAPLAAGLVDALQRVGVPAFGPTMAAARLESSKAFAKEIMDAAGVATAGWRSFTNPSAAIAHLRSSDGPYVVKADGLAAGKGVLVSTDRDEAERWAWHCFDGGFGDAGTKVVIEEFLDGPELSVFAVTDGSRAVALESARDYKRLGDGDAGPNTGGMGSYSPVPSLPAGIVGHTLDAVVAPVLAEMRSRATPFSGFLYVGFVLTDDGPRVLEFNCRLGDPETQAVLPRLRGSLADLLLGAATGALTNHPLDWDSRSAVNVVMAAAGYPTEPRQGDQIAGSLDQRADSLVFHAGTELQGSRLLTAGGRVVSVVGLGADLRAARTAAYERVATISWPGVQYRTDIAGEK